MLFSLTVQSIAVIMFIEGIRGPLIIISCYALKATFWKNIHFLAKGYGLFQIFLDLVGTQLTKNNKLLPMAWFCHVCIYKIQCICLTYSSQVIDLFMTQILN